MIIDANVILRAFLPDEEQDQAQALIRDHVLGHVHLAAPELVLYEVTNAVLQAVRRGRLTSDQADGILSSFEGLALTVKPVGWRAMFSIAQRLGRSAYDAAYLALAEADDQPLITGDTRMYNAVRAEFPLVRWIGDYQGLPRLSEI